MLAIAPAAALTPTHASPLAQACDEFCPKFGFQPSSVRNQRENVLMLAANIYSTVEPGEVRGRSQEARAVTALHAHTLGSYENWALNMHGLGKQEAYQRQESVANDRGADGLNGNPANDRRVFD